MKPKIKLKLKRNAVVVKLEHPSTKTELLTMLDNVRTDVINGNIHRLGIVAKRYGSWSSEFSSSPSRLEDGAMLIELGIRRLGF